MMRRLITTTLACLATVVAAGVTVPGLAIAAEQASPWFHLSTTSTPGNLSAGHTSPEIQEIVATEGEFLGLGIDCEAVELSVNGVLVGGTAELPGVFLTEPCHQAVEELFEAKSVLLNAANLKAALEGPQAYGPGGVEVSEKPAPAGSVAFTVKGAGNYTDRPLYDAAQTSEAIYAAPFFGTGTAKASVVSQGASDGEIVVTAINVGNAAANGEAAPVTLSDVLPKHLKALYVQANTRNNGGGTERGPVACQLGSLTCTYSEGCNLKRTGFCGLTEHEGTIPPFNEIEMVVGVEVQNGAESGEINEASVSGGGAPLAQAHNQIVVSSSPTPFGVEDYELTPEEVGGGADVQAGSHPYQLTTTLDLTATTLQEGQTVVSPAAQAKDLEFKLPAGLVGDPTAYPTCTLSQFSHNESCPLSTVLGVAVVTYYETVSTSGARGLTTVAVPLYNMEPAPGEPARFAFAPGGVPVFLDTSVRTGEDYGVTVHVHNIPQMVGFLSNSVTFWGVPGAESHDISRGLNCIRQSVNEFLSEKERLAVPCEDLHESNARPFMTLPTVCSGEPLATEVFADSWAEPSREVGPSPNPTESMPTLDGCGALPFNAGIKVAADEESASTPSGLKVDVHVPQQEALNPTGFAPATVKSIKVTLPDGVSLNPAAGDGLQACSEAQVGLHDDSEVACPDASKIANVTITTPLLPNPLKGSVYLASPQNFAGALENPFGSLVAMYLVARDPVSGTLVKLAGNVSLSPTGQITSTFAENPDLPFEDAEIEFFGGERAPLVTPAHCGPYTTNAVFEPWSNTPVNHEAVHAGSTFDIASGVNGSACPGSGLSFAPSLASGSTNIDAGAFSPLVTTLSREDGQQSIGSVVLHYPPGVSGILAGVKLCDEADANAGTCPAESMIGETIVSVGLGGDPFSVTGGKVYLTEKYGGAPFGLSIVNPAKAGPFDLQEGRPVVVRAKVEVDPETAALTIVTDSSGPHAIPKIIEGIPLQIRHVNVTITRPGFTFNPTNCEPMSITGSVASVEGSSSPVSVPFQVTNCAVLGFKPRFEISTSGKTSRANGANLHVKLTYPKAAFGTQANLKAVKVDLPEQLPSRLETLKLACLASTFESNPAACPAASRVGSVLVHTQLLPVPLEGPAYFVSYGGAKFPELVFALQGYGVTVDVHGETFIANGITSTTIRSAPDVPFESFELSLPQGKYSALAANTDLCAITKTVLVKRKVKVRSRGHAKTVTRKVKETVAGGLVMPTAFTAQNGSEIHQNTPIEVTGCGAKAKRKAKPSKHHKKK